VKFGSNKIKLICQINTEGGISYFDQNTAQYFVEPKKKQTINQFKKIGIHEISFIETKNTKSHVESPKNKMYNLEYQREKKSSLDLSLEIIQALCNFPEGQKKCEQLSGIKYNGFNALAIYNHIINDFEELL